MGSALMIKNQNRLRLNKLLLSYGCFTLMSLDLLPRLIFSGHQIEKLRYLEWLQAYRKTTCLLEFWGEKLYLENIEDFQEFYSYSPEKEVVLDYYTDVMEHLDEFIKKKKIRESKPKSNIGRRIATLEDQYRAAGIYGPKVDEHIKKVKEQKRIKYLNLRKTYLEKIEKEKERLREAERVRGEAPGYEGSSSGSYKEDTEVGMENLKSEDKFDAERSLEQKDADNKNSFHSSYKNIGSSSQIKSFTDKDTTKKNQRIEKK